MKKNEITNEEHKLLIYCIFIVESFKSLLNVQNIAINKAYLKKVKGVLNLISTI